MALSAEEIFGISQKHRTPSHTGSSDPVVIPNLQKLTRQLSEIRLLGRKGYCKFINEVFWGPEEPGSIGVFISPGYSIGCKRLCVDLEGLPRWVHKKGFQLNRKGGQLNYDRIVDEISKELQAISKLPLDQPGHLSLPIEIFASKLFQAITPKAPHIFHPLGIYKITPTNVQIVYEISAGGVGAPDHMRVESNVTDIFYDKGPGVIRINNYNIESNTTSHRNFEITPSDFAEEFLPSQSFEEIASAIGLHLRCY